MGVSREFSTSNNGKRVLQTQILRPLARYILEVNAIPIRTFAWLFGVLAAWTGTAVLNVPTQLPEPSGRSCCSHYQLTLGD